MKTDCDIGEEDLFWLATPENPGNETEHTPIQKRILIDVRELAGKETFYPSKNSETQEIFLNLLQWEDSFIQGKAKQQLEDVIVEYNNIFARHRLDVGTNNNFKVQLTPKTDNPVYTQSLPVESSFMYRYGFITTSPISKICKPIYKQRKPNCKRVDQRKVNALKSDDYINNNHRISTHSQILHTLREKLFCKPDCSQAYHCLQMADQRSAELLAFNFASRTFALKRLTQGLSIALSAFSSFTSEFLDKVRKANQSAQFADNIGIPANSVTKLIQTIRADFECIRNAGLKLTIDKCHFGVIKVEFLGRTTIPL